MEVVTFIREYKRMCEFYKDCRDCPLDYKCPQTHNLMDMEMDNVLPVINVVNEWSKSHPIKTYLTDFFEKHPNAPREGGLPIPCAKSLGYVNNCCDYKCKKCWNTPLDEAKIL